MSTEFEEKITKQASVYRVLGQGLKILHDHQYADVDILAIPGLGTNPEECWTWAPDVEDAGKHDGRNGSTALSGPTETSKRKFNWLRDPDGLASLFPKSRIMLYDYASAWQGKRKVRATMKSICTWLLDDLREKRKGGNEIVRPLIIIGHSMGGIVAAKTICIARAKREFEPIVNYTIGCAFFGVPFRGSDMAKIALLYSSVFGNEAYESLLSFMRTEKNDTLDEVTSDFMEICSKLVPPVDLFCAWEQNPTAASYSERVSSKVPGLLQQEFFKAGARKFMETGFSAFGSGTHFVEKESAELQGAHCVGLTAGHNDLIKFESITSTKFGPVKVALSKMVQMAKINARKRALVSGERLLPQKFVNQVRQSLEGVDMRSMFRTKVAQRRINTWLSSEPLYQQWLSPGGRADPQNSYLWLKGGAGLGKTNASLAAIQQLTNSHSDQNAMENTGPHSETFLAYFLCERLPGYCTAEDVLKSLITQLINQDESLAQHGRWFVPNPRYRGPAHLDTRPADDPVNSSGAKATATVDNLWKCLQDMIDDPVVNSIHIVLSNVHYLDSNVSTVALLAKLRAAAFETMPQAVRTARWLVTSRGDKHIREYLTAEFISVIDLDDNVEYGGKVKAARQNHARDAVVQLRLTKKYSPDLAYYIRNFVESQSEDEKWIDILCILLKAKPIEESNLSIRKWLREAGSYSTPNLVDHAWDTILKQDADAMLETEELIQTLTVAYEPPTLAELAVLTQIDNLQRLSALVQNCSPVVQVGSDSKVTFAKPEFKQRLEYMFFGHPDSSSVARKRYHGLMALRCFKCIKASYDVRKESDYMFELSADERVRSRLSPTPITASLVSDGEIIMVSRDDDVSQMVDSPISATSTLKGSYPVKYLFQHLSEGFPDAVQELFEDDPGFWGGSSAIRDRWLEDFRVLSTNFKELNTRGMSTLHVAAGIGANDLVSILIDKNGKASSSWANTDGMTALHVAAFNNHCDAVDTLIRAGADIETGEGEAGTPLHLAALRGNCAVMTLLIEKEANVNALSKTIGPVINAAIRSGTVDAVQLIISGAVHFDVDYITYDPPLSLSAGISEPSLFKDILTSGRAKWLQNVKLLDQALIAASYSGRLQSVCILLEFDHIYTNNTVQTAVLSAAIEKNWASVNELLDYAIKDTAVGNRRDVQLDDTFYFAATNREERLAILEKIWSFTNHSIAQDILNFSLYQATVLNKYATVEWLLERCGADPNTSAERPQFIAHYASVASSSDFWNPLNAAASSGNILIIKALIRKGAEVDGERVYALQLAARDGHTEAVDILLEHGAAVNKVVADSEELGFFSATALQAACDNKRIGVVGALLKHDADPNLGGGTFTNPITAATQKPQPEILKLLLDAPDIEVNVFGGEDKSTPLINAATYMSIDSVELLVRRGAELDTQNAMGDTALIMASWKGDKDCVVLLCNEGADVTYRSPHRGLAITAAADGLHPECATVLADRMGGKIESYREQVKIDPSKERLKEALAQLRSREQTIGELKADLIELQEQLESANKDIDFYQHEKKRLMSASSFHGETYESTSQQVRAMQTERAELLKQLDAARGQTGLANEAVDRIQALLNNERKANASLRQKQELTTLQDDIKHAQDSIVAEKQKSLGLQHEIRLLQNTILALKDEVTAVQADEQAAVAAAVIERHKQDALKDDVKVLENKLRAEVLSSVQATAERNAHQPNSPPSRNDLNPIARNDYPRFPASRAQSDRDPGLAMGAAARFSRSQTTSPIPQAKGPGTETGFRTIHGQHRPDGSLGGYRPDRAVQRTPSDNLYESSVQNGQSGERTLSPQTSRSDGQSVTSSDEAQPGQGWGTPPKRKDETERTRWG